MLISLASVICILFTKQFLRLTSLPYESFYIPTFFVQLSILFNVFRKKKKNKAKKVLEDVSHSISKGGSEESQEQVTAKDTRTPAQIAYDKIQEKRVCTDTCINI